MVSLSLEALSSVLQKNPHFVLLPMDMKFLESFQEIWKRVVTDDSDFPSKSDRYDCVMNCPYRCVCGNCTRDWNETTS